MKKYRVTGGHAYVSRHDGGCSRTQFILPPDSIIVGDIEEAEWVPELDDFRVRTAKRVDKRRAAARERFIKDLAAWEELWHATKDVVIVGHKPGTHVCPYQVGHSLREHCLHLAPQVEARFQALIAASRHVETSQEGKAG